MVMKTSRDTKLMQRAEGILGRPLEEGLAECITLHGLTGTANLLQVTPAVVRYWMKKFGIHTMYLALARQDSLSIIRNQEEDELVSSGTGL